MSIAGKHERRAAGLPIVIREIRQTPLRSGSKIIALLFKVASVRDVTLPLNRARFGCTRITDTHNFI